MLSLKNPGLILDSGHASGAQGSANFFRERAFGTSNFRLETLMQSFSRVSLLVFVCAQSALILHIRGGFIAITKVHGLNMPRYLVFKGSKN